MRGLLALSGWLEVLLPSGAWLGSDAAVRPLALAHVGRAGDPEPPPVAVNERRSVRVVLAGELYNGAELRATLSGKHDFQGHDDAEVVAHLYEERGINAVKALRGAFALALWDARQQKLLCARDQLGVVPLYYSADEGRLAVSTSLATLVARPGIPTTWDASALDGFLTLGMVPPPATLYLAIRQLRPGELLLWENGRVRLQRYWQLTFPERRLVRADLPSLILGQVRESLRLRRSAGDALLLSSGLGAATLLGLATVEQLPFARAYTAAVPHDDGAEIREAGKLAATAGVPHVGVGDPLDWASTVDALLAAHGGPIGGPEMPVLHAVVGRAAGNLAFAIAGSGGEEVLGGAPPARIAERIRRYHRLPDLAREWIEGLMRVAPGGAAASFRRMAQDARLAPIEMYTRAVSRLDARERAALYTPEALASFGDARPWAPLTTLFSEAVTSGAQDAADAVHYVELTLGLPARLEAVSAAAAGFQLRFPFVDHRVAQFAASVQPWARGNASSSRLLLRGAVGDLLPRHVARASHRSPAPRPRAWRTGTLRSFLEETLAAARVGAQGIFRPDTVERLCREQVAGRCDHSQILWALLLTTRWLERRAMPVATPIRAAV
jgi:asparagine synthase (glutamine-hydrolysing)